MRRSPRARILAGMAVVLKALTAAVLFTVVTTCGDVAPTNVTKLTPPDSALNYPPRPIDWYICTSHDGGNTFRCAFSHTEYQSMNVDRWSGDVWYTNTPDCLLAPDYCGPNLFGNDSPYPDPTAVPASANDARAASLFTTYPTCPPPKDAQGRVDPVDAAWCKGKRPSESQVTLIRNALQRMRDKGGRCAQLADLGDILLARNAADPAFKALRVFTQSTHDGGGGATTGGALPENGGPYGDKSWMVLSNHNFGWADADHASPSRPPHYPYRTTIQWAVAHELDHLLGNTHVIVDGRVDHYVTPYTKVCSDVAHLNPTAPGAATP